MEEARVKTGGVEGCVKMRKGAYLIPFVSCPKAYDSKEAYSIPSLASSVYPHDPVLLASSLTKPS